MSTGVKTNIESYSGIPGSFSFRIILNSIRSQTDAEAVGFLLILMWKFINNETGRFHGLQRYGGMRWKYTEKKKTNYLSVLSTGCAFRSRNSFPLPCRIHRHHASLYAWPHMDTRRTCETFRASAIPIRPFIFSIFLYEWIMLNFLVTQWEYERRYVYVFRRAYSSISFF